MTKQNKKEFDNKPVILIGYSGHAYVVTDIILSSGREIIGYCETEKKDANPYQLSYLGSEESNQNLYSEGSNTCFVAIGNNTLRNKISTYLIESGAEMTNVVHPSAIVSDNVKLEKGIMLGHGCIINSCAVISKGVICNTGSIIEHECNIGEYAHIAPGTVLCGNVNIGARTFIGAGAVIKQGVTVGDDVVIGAGTVVIKDVVSGSTVVGNPQRLIK